MLARDVPLTAAGEGTGDTGEAIVEDLRLNFGIRVSENLCMDRTTVITAKELATGCLVAVTVTGWGTPWRPWARC
jgi:hypothetical protein